MEDLTKKIVNEEKNLKCKRKDIICWEPYGGYKYINCINTETGDGKCNYAKFSSEKECKFYHQKPDASEYEDGEAD